MSFFDAMAGKVDIITGASSGIGEASTHLFTSYGALVVIADIQDQLGLDVAASLGLKKCTYRHCDVTNENQVKETVAYTIHIYLQSARHLGSILDINTSELDRIIVVKVLEATVSIKYAARAMVAQATRGLIVCTTSVAASRTEPGLAAYTASKHALMGLVKSDAGELGVHGIMVNCISLSGVATPLACGYGDTTPVGGESAMASKNDIGREVGGEAGVRASLC